MFTYFLFRHWTPALARPIAVKLYLMMAMRKGAMSRPTCYIALLIKLWEDSMNSSGLQSWKWQLSRRLFAWDSGSVARTIGPAVQHGIYINRQNQPH